jgi:hypothetical protein
MTTPDTTISLPPSDRLVKLIWQMALSSGENIPMPTIARVAALKRMAASWRLEDMDRMPTES